jgi:transketolase
MTKTSQRDAFFGRLYEIARQDNNVVIVSADMGAPALDRIRRDLPGQFVNVGIAEQNATTLAAGLALTGKKVFTYAIAPFITLRCLEQIRVSNAIMDIPINVVGVGSGFSYEDSGPTHHLIEDLAIMRSMPNITVHNITDGVMAAALADVCVASTSTNYIRLDREALPDLYPQGTTFADGYAVLRPAPHYYILTTGNLCHNALQIAAALADRGVQVGVIDVYRLPLNPALLAALAGAKKIVSLEEHFLPGGLGGALCELICDSGSALPIRRFGLEHSKGYCYQYGGREVIRGYYGLGQGQVLEAMGSYFAS